MLLDDLALQIDRTDFSHDGSSIKMSARVELEGLAQGLVGGLFRVGVGDGQGNGQRDVQVAWRLDWDASALESRALSDSRTSGRGLGDGAIRRRHDALRPERRFPWCDGQIQRDIPTFHAKSRLLFESNLEVKVAGASLPDTGGSLSGEPQALAVEDPLWNRYIERARL